MKKDELCFSVSWLHSFITSLSMLHCLKCVVLAIKTYLI